MIWPNPNLIDPSGERIAAPPQPVAPALAAALSLPDWDDQPASLNATTVVPAALGAHRRWWRAISCFYQQPQ